MQMVGNKLAKMWQHLNQANRVACLIGPQYLYTVHTIIHFIETRLHNIQLAQQQKYRWLG